METLHLCEEWSHNPLRFKYSVSRARQSDAQLLGFGSTAGQSEPVVGQTHPHSKGQSTCVPHGLCVTYAAVLEPKGVGMTCAYLTGHVSSVQSKPMQQFGCCCASQPESRPLPGTVVHAVLVLVHCQG